MNAKEARAQTDKRKEEIINSSSTYIEIINKRIVDKIKTAEYYVRLSDRFDEELQPIFLSGHIRREVIRHYKNMGFKVIDTVGIYGEHIEISWELEGGE